MFGGSDDLDDDFDNDDEFEDADEDEDLPDGGHGGDDEMGVRFSVRIREDFRRDFPNLRLPASVEVEIRREDDH